MLAIDNQKSITKGLIPLIPTPWKNAFRFLGFTTKFYPEIGITFLTIKLIPKPIKITPPTKPR